MKKSDNEKTCGASCQGMKGEVTEMTPIIIPRYKKDGSPNEIDLTDDKQIQEIMEKHAGLQGHVYPLPKLKS